MPLVCPVCEGPLVERSAGSDLHGPCRMTYCWGGFCYESFSYLSGRQIRTIGARTWEWQSQNDTPETIELRTDEIYWALQEARIQHRQNHKEPVRPEPPPASWLRYGF